MSAARLLAWYGRHRRDLPWRRDRDPYRVWLSEVMLQQTRVDVVAPYFERFVARFPDVEALAAADLDEVLACWSGLGYYRRARQLHAAARQISQSGGQFPSTVDGLSALPGVGAYTAAAVASISFAVPVAVVDGNVERVMARVAALAGDPRTAAGRRSVAALAERLLDPRRPGDSNQALMELGATVCTPRRPDCGTCPLLEPTAGGDGSAWEGCRAGLAGEPEKHPPPRRRRPVERRRRLVAMVEDAEGRLLLFRRSETSSLLAGTWELPSVPWPEDVVADDDLGRALGDRYGGGWRIGGRLATVRHGITFRDLELVVHRAALERGNGVAEGGAEAAWHRRPELAGLPLSSMVTKTLAAIATAADDPRPASAPTRGGRRRR